MPAFPQLFSPIFIGSVELKNRIVMPAMCTNFPDDGSVNRQMVDYFARRAQGGVGLIIPEAAQVTVHPQSRLAKFHLNISEDSFIPSLKKLTDAVHPYGAKIALQLSHFGRQSHSTFNGAPIVAPSSIPCPVNREVPRELTIREIESLIESFIQAARRACEAGCDMVEIHASHGYLISEFLSRRSNRRTDLYGSDAEGRSRFCAEIVKGIKKSSGESFPVIVRINGHDYIDGGADLEEMLEVLPFITAAGADALHVSAGVYGSYRATVAPMFEKPGCFVHLAKAVKEVVNVPVIAVGRINDPHLAEEILSTGKADLVAVGRNLLADPDWPDKARTGNSENILKCTGCNQGCIDRLNESMMATVREKITCLVNPLVGKEKEEQILPVLHPKKIIVIGSGPAGLQAALTAARRGHKVTIREKEKVAGGQLLLAGSVPGRESFRYYIEFMEKQVSQAGIEMLTDKDTTPEEIIAFKPDAVIIASGALPIVPAFVKTGNTNVFTAWEILRGNIPEGRHMAVLGGGAVGLETALLLAGGGKKIEVLELTGTLGGDMGRIASFYLRNMLKDAGVNFLRFAEVKEVSNNEIVFIQNGQERRITNLDAVILALGAKSHNPLAAKIKGNVPEIHVIGDCVRPQKALDAIAEGFNLGRRI